MQRQQQMMQMQQSQIQQNQMQQNQMQQNQMHMQQVQSQQQQHYIQQQVNVKKKFKMNISKQLEDDFFLNKLIIFIIFVPSAGC